MRNLSDACKTCKDNHFSMSMCFDCCGVPIDILEEIERKRTEEEKLLVRYKFIRKVESEDKE